MSAAKLAWQRKARSAFKERNGYSQKATYETGGRRAAVLERDGHKCVRCGMTEAEHLARWNKPITIDHRDRNRKNNTPENLQTLCLECHGEKEQSLNRESRFLAFLIQ